LKKKYSVDQSALVFFMQDFVVEALRLMVNCAETVLLKSCRVYGRAAIDLNSGS
jgi:hypothetical protein